MLKTIQLPHSNYLITYYKTLDEFTRLLRSEKLNKRQMFWKNLKLQILSNKVLKFVRLTVENKSIEKKNMQ